MTEKKQPAKKARTSRPRRTERFLRAQIDIAIETEKPMGRMPKVNVGGLMNVIATFLAQAVNKDVDVYKSPGGQIRLSLLDKPPRKMKSAIEENKKRAAKKEK